VAPRIWGLEIEEKCLFHDRFSETPFPTGTIDDGPDPGIRVAMATTEDESCEVALATQYGWVMDDGWE